MPPWAACLPLSPFMWVASAVCLPLSPFMWLLVSACLPFPSCGWPRPAPWAACLRLSPFVSMASAFSSACLCPLISLCLFVGGPAPWAASPLVFLCLPCGWPLPSGLLFPLMWVASTSWAVCGLLVPACLLDVGGLGRLPGLLALVSLCLPSWAACLCLSPLVSLCLSLCGWSRLVCWAACFSLISLYQVASASSLGCLSPLVSLDRLPGLLVGACFLFCLPSCECRFSGLLVSTCLHLSPLVSLHVGGGCLSPLVCSCGCPAGSSAACLLLCSPNSSPIPTPQGWTLAQHIVPTFTPQMLGQRPRLRVNIPSRHLIHGIAVTYMSVMH